MKRVISAYRATRFWAGGGVLAPSDEYWQPTINTNLFAAVRLDRFRIAPRQHFRT